MFVFECCSLFTSFFDHLFDEFPCFGCPFFEHEICIDLSSILVWMLVSFLNLFWYLYLSHMQPSKPSKRIVFTICLMIFLSFFRYQFWHWFLMSFGIDFGSLLGPLWHQIPCFVLIVCLMIFCIVCWSVFYKKGFPKNGDGALSFQYVFASFFRALVPFTHVRPASARHYVFQISFSENKKNFPHLYLLQT